MIADPAVSDPDLLTNEGQGFEMKSQSATAHPDNKRMPLIQLEPCMRRYYSQEAEAWQEAAARAYAPRFLIVWKIAVIIR